MKGHCVETPKTYLMKQKAMQKVSSMLTCRNAQPLAQVQPLIQTPSVFQIGHHSKLETEIMHCYVFGVADESLV